MLGIMYVKMMFQFQCGAIERRLSVTRRSLYRSFQFQCGAIESTSNIFSVDVSLQFQFQCGAIESWIDWIR